MNNSCFRKPLNRVRHAPKCCPDTLVPIKQMPFLGLLRRIMRTHRLGLWIR